MKFAIISDTHIGGKFNEKMFNKGIDAFNEIDADFYIFTGDLTDQGTLSQYEQFKEKYGPIIKQDLLMVPGNHDVKNVGDLLWEEYIGPRYFVKTDEERKVRILGLDSNEPDKNTGRMGEKAIERIYSEFQELDDNWLKVLVFHHQTLPIKYTGRERSALVDAGDTIKAIMDCNIDLVLNGHRHISNVYTLTDGDINTLIVNCGTLSCKKTRYHEEYSLTTVEINKEQSHGEVEVLLLKSDSKWKTIFNGDITNPSKPDYFGDLLTTIIQIGNSDFSENYFDLENYANGVNMINSLDTCDVVVHTGDVTAHSYMMEFEMAKSLLSQIHQEKIILPGPRDYYSLGYELFPNYIGATDPDFENDNLKLMGLNSCILEEKIGRLGRSRCSTLEDTFRKTNKVKAVAFHHTIIPLPRAKHESELEDAGDVLALFIDQEIDLVLTGAKNKSGAWQVGKTVFVNSGTISSKNIVTSKGNSFNIIQIYKTDIGKYYKIDEYFIETADLSPLGRFHIRD